MHATPPVLIAAAPTLYRAGLVALLREQWPAHALTLTADASQLASLVQAQPFLVLILDDTLPGRGLPALLHQVHLARPNQRLLLLASSYSGPAAGAVLGGALRVPRHIAPSHLAAALAPWLDEAPSGHAPHHAPLGTAFSPRELEVLRLVVDDNCNRAIADHLYLSVRTVESHRRALLQKSGTRTLAGLVAWALREGMVA